jgi:hypothetical protein
MADCVFLGIVRSERASRESLFEFNPEPIEDIKKYLDFVAGQSEEALVRLKMFVES